MMVEFEGDVRRGRALDLDGWSVSGRCVYRAIHGEETVVDVSCAEPTPVHDHVGYVRPGMDLRLPAALAAAARSRGLTAPEDEERRTLEAQLAQLDAPEIDDTAERKALAETGRRQRALRERVATLQGRLQARKAEQLDVSHIEAAVTDAIKELSEVETERIAAQQRFERVRERARIARDRRSERLRLADRIDNLARAARRRLVAELAPAFAEAVEVVPGRGTPGDEPATFSGPPETAALAVAHVAEVNAPLVLDGEWFDTAEAAAACLGAPVVRL